MIFFQRIQIIGWMSETKIIEGSGNKLHKCEVEEN